VNLKKNVGVYGNANFQVFVHANLLAIHVDNAIN
jgi:hypothetical protein